MQTTITTYDRTISVIKVDAKIAKDKTIDRYVRGLRFATNERA